MTHTYIYTLKLPGARQHQNITTDVPPPKPAPQQLAQLCPVLALTGLGIWIVLKLIQSAVKHHKAGISPSFSLHFEWV